MLLGQNFSGSHHRYLKIVIDGLTGSNGGHHRLATADVALKQSLHRPGLHKVFADFGNYFLLFVRQGKRQTPDECFCQ